MSVRSEVIRIFNELIGQAKKISDLPAAGSVAGADLVEVSQGGVSKKATITQVASGGAAVWGGIGGTLSDQTDLQTALNLKSPLDSPTFTGTPAAPTAAPGTNTTQLATTAFVLANGAGVTDGDKGDITVSGSGATWAIDNLAVTDAKINDVALGKVTGLGSNVATFLATPSSANLASAVTDEVGTGSLVLSEPDVNVQTGSYTLVLADKAKEVRMNVAGSNNLTVPLNSSVAFPTGTLIVLTQYGAGTTTVVATGGVTINSSAGNLLSPGQYSPMILRKIGTDEWYLWNGASASTAAFTRTNGTYITTTLGGSPSGALNTAVDITVELTGVVPLTLGGTGASSATQTYTPTLTNTANVAASTARLCTYMRVGNVVTVSGQLDIDPTTTATLTTLGISLPIASDFTTAFQLGGTAAAIGVADAAAGIQADATNNRATLQYVCTDVTNHTMTFTFTYQVL